MRLTPTEEERLHVFAAAELARRSLAHGLKLNAPEAIAVVCDAMHLAARRGGSYEDVAAAGRTALTPEDVMDGVADIATEIRLEVLLEEGSRLIVVREPFGPATAEGPGAVRFGEGDVALVPGDVAGPLNELGSHTVPGNTVAGSEAGTGRAIGGSGGGGS